MLVWSHSHYLALQISFVFPLSIFGFCSSVSFIKQLIFFNLRELVAMGRCVLQTTGASVKMYRCMACFSGSCSEINCSCVNNTCRKITIVFSVLPVWKLNDLWQLGNVLHTLLSYLNKIKSKNLGDYSNHHMNWNYQIKHITNNTRKAKYSLNSILHSLHASFGNKILLYKVIYSSFCFMPTLYCVLYVKLKWML